MRVRYIVKKEDGVVVCLGEGTALDVAKELKFIDKKPDVEELINIYPFLISDVFKGVARLSDEDVWDEDVGKKVAYAKMMAKYNYAKYKVVFDLCEDTAQSLSVFVKLRDKFLRAKYNFEDEVHYSV